MQLSINNGIRYFLSLVLLMHSVYGHTADIRIDWFSDVDISVGRNDNISQAERQRDTVDDNFITVNYSLLSNIELTDFDTITIKGFVEAQQQEFVEDLSRTTIGMGFIYRWQHSLGYFEPFFQFNTTIQLDEYGVDQRDSTVLKSQLFMNKRLTDALVLVTGLEYWQQDSDGSVFDLSRNRVFLNLDYNTKNNSTYYASYSYSKGDIWSSAQIRFCDGIAADDIFPILSGAEEKEPDAVFNNALCGDWVAYQLKANTHTLSAGYNRAVGDSSAIDISVMSINSSANADINYRSNIYRFSYLVRF